MAITTDFIGHVGIEPALDSDQIDHLAALRSSRTRATVGRRSQRVGGVRRTVAA